MQNQKSLLATRRSFLTRSGLAVSALAVASACEDEITGQLPINASWEEIADRLERSNGVGTPSNLLGRPQGQVATHVPIITVSADIVRVENPAAHPMDETHWISHLYVKNQEGIVFGMQEYIARGTGRADQAVAEFIIPSNTTAITAFSYCNLHDIWASEPYRIG